MKRNRDEGTPVKYGHFLSYFEVPPEHRFMHVAFIHGPDGLIWHKSPANGPSHVSDKGQMLVTHASAASTKMAYYR